MLVTEQDIYKDNYYLEAGEAKIPLLKKADAVVVGGSLAGVAFAGRMARAGLKVVLIESRTYLGWEITAKFRPWVNISNNLEQEALSRLFKKSFQVEDNYKQEIPLKPDDIKISLEDYLLETGVELIYASHVVDFFIKDKDLGVIIGNKSGRQVILGKVIIDGTEYGSVLSLTVENKVLPADNKIICWRTLEFINGGPLRVKELSVPEALGIKGNRIKLHAGYRGKGHILVEFPLEFSGGYSLEDIMARESKARRVSFNLISYLLERVPEFRGASFTDASPELFDPDFNLGLVERKEFKASLNSLTTSSPRLWHFQGLDKGNAPGLVLAGESLASMLVNNWEEVTGAPCKLPRKGYNPGRVKMINLKLPDLNSTLPGRKYGLIAVPEWEVPVKKKADVLVVGGGSSGALAAIKAAQEGVKTILVDMNPGPGGTGTYGGVDSYWFGRKIGYSAQVSKKLARVHQKIKHQSNKWNIQAREFTLREMAAKAGVEMIFNAIVINVLTEGNKISGVLVASQLGVFAIKSRIVIDATGDGDLVAFAGGKFVYGSDEDQSVMWYSLAQFPEPGRSKNNFTSMVDVSNIRDYTRSILVGRRRNEERDNHDHGIYLAPRESRHIIGDYVLTQTDQLKQRKWDDVINIHFSNTDIKGKSSSKWIRMGLIPPNLEIEIPYRVLFPRELKGLMVVGKAISATHDAFPSIRMQADLENLGGVAGLAAALSILSGTPPRKLDLSRLQKRLVTEGILPEEVLDRKIEKEEYSEKELEQLVKKLSASKPLYSYSNMEMDEVFEGKIPIVEICTAGERIIPYLLEEMDSSSGARKVLIAKALAFYGHRQAVPILVEEINKNLSGGRLPLRNSHILYAGFPPDQGAMPDVVYLIYTLGLIPDKRNLKVWERVVDLLPVDEESFRDGRRGIFYYIDAVCFGAAKYRGVEAIPILERLHEHKLLCNLVQEKGFEVDYFWERQAMLELAIGRALARCGSRKGYQILISYLNDNRSLLANEAYRELVNLKNKIFFNGINNCPSKRGVDG